MNSSSSGGGINIAASARKIDVDNRIALRYYYRIADNILRQADIFRAEKNVIDLYVMLLRFSSLITETIPHHQDYRNTLQSNNLKKRLLKALSELEELKPAVQLKIDELNNKHTYQGSLHQNDSLDSKSQWSFPTPNYGKTKPAVPNFVYQSSRIHQSSHARPVDEQIRKLSLNIPRPKEETLSKHSILGPNGLGGQWQPPLIDKAVQYPINLDLSPVMFPSLQWPVEGAVTIKQDNSISEAERLSVESILKPDIDSQVKHSEEVVSMISFEAETPIIRQPSPPPVLAEIQDLIPSISSGGPQSGNGMSMSNGLVCSESPLQLHISTAVMENFMRLAKSNTDKNLETCGVLAGSLKNRKFYVTALIIPKQESTSDSCHTTNEEEIFEVQDKQSLFPLGWIHTHPTQSCFMSSIDVHTQYSYQIMLPEAIAIVMAPRDGSRKHGIFRLTNPGGMSVVRKCPRRGFHSHEPPAEGGPIYDKCTDVFINPNINFDVIDLR